MNILFISPSNTIGGAEISLKETIEFLEKSDIRCYVLIHKSKENIYGQILEELATRVFYHKIPGFSATKISLLTLGSIISFLYNYYKRGFNYSAVNYIRLIIRNEKIDVVHSNTVHSIVGKIAANKEKIPHILHIREITGQIKHSHVFLKGQDKSRFKEKWGLHDGLIVNSYFCLHQNLVYFGAKVVKVFYNPITAEFGSHAEKKMTGTIGMVANVTSPLKKHAEFITICKIISLVNPGAEFRIFGALPEAENPYYKQLRSQVEKSGLNDSLKFMGLYDKKEIYASLDILVHPYPNEAFGRIFIEAMSAGVPVVAAAAGGALELIRNNETGLLYPPCRPDSAAEKVLNIWNDDELRKKLIKKGKLKAQEFLPEVVLSGLPEFYNRVINSYYGDQNT